MAAAGYGGGPGGTCRTSRGHDRGDNPRALETGRRRALNANNRQLELRKAAHNDERPASVAGIPLADFPGYSKAMVDELVNATHFGGAEVIKRKGGTFYAVAPMICELIKAIHHDTHQVLPVSTLLEGEFLDMRDVALSLPNVIGKPGRVKLIPPPLSDDEKASLLKSYNVLREALESVGC